MSRFVSKGEPTVRRLLPADHKAAHEAALKEQLLVNEMAKNRLFEGPPRTCKGMAGWKKLQQRHRRVMFRFWLLEMVDVVFESPSEIDELFPRSWKFTTLANRTVEELTMICRGDVGLAYELYDRVQDALRQGGIPGDRN